MINCARWETPKKFDRHRDCITLSSLDIDKIITFDFDGHAIRIGTLMSWFSPPETLTKFNIQKSIGTRPFKTLPELTDDQKAALAKDCFRYSAAKAQEYLAIVYYLREEQFAAIVEGCRILKVCS